MQSDADHDERGAVVARIAALEDAVLALIQYSAGRYGFDNTKAYLLSTAIAEARDAYLESENRGLDNCL